MRRGPLLHNVPDSYTEDFNFASQIQNTVPDLISLVTPQPQHIFSSKYKHGQKSTSLCVRRCCASEPRTLCSASLPTETPQQPSLPMGHLMHHYDVDGSNKMKAFI
jgi:hypothetical protein